MGTKRSLVPQMHDQIIEEANSRPVLDLFTGMGSVVESLRDQVPVVANDFLQFASAFSRARILPREPLDPDKLLRGLLGSYLAQRKKLMAKYKRRLKGEEAALCCSQASFLEYLESVSHVGTSEHYQREAKNRSKRNHELHHSMVTAYFSGGYFSTQQAIDLDSIRFAIDRGAWRGTTRDWLLSCWVLCAGKLCNAPGHTAQFLRPNNDPAYQRILRTWKRSAWTAFLDSMEELTLIGSSKWRAGNKVFNRDALNLLPNLKKNSVGVIYADPPYTKDQYQRFYHVLESLYRYNYPESRGRGRTPAYDCISEFSSLKLVESAFTKLFKNCSRIDATLILSYPKSGLLSQKGVEVESLASKWMSLSDVTKIEYGHSTLGGSNGAQKKITIENIYVFHPK